MARFNQNKNNKGNRDNGDGGNGDASLPTHYSTMEIKEPRCHICQSKFRRTIDYLLTLGMPFAEIARQFEGENLSRKSIANHRGKHLTVNDAVTRQILEDKAKQLGEDIENGKRTVLTRRGVLEVLMMRGYGGVISGAVPVEARDVVALVQQLEKMDESSASVQVEELNLQLHCMLDAIKTVIPKGYFGQIQQEFDRLLSSRGKILDAYAIELPELEYPPDLKDLGNNDG